METPIAQSAITKVNIEDEMCTAYLDYAMSVIIGRALPDVRDGLKPVHRRVLYAMFREGLLHNRKYSKCAGVVGEVLKKYHPHGDSAVYDTLVRMAQPWNMRYPLVDGQGNFGSIDGDSAAAYRYTECRMKHLAELMLKDIDKKTVDFTDNFDGSTQEPTVFPTRFPELLVNGSDGIAVGMATKIPPHNLTEIINACVHLIDHPETTVKELVLGRQAPEGEEGEEGESFSFGPIVPGPDFPTGGIVYGLDGILQAYETGRGIVRIRSLADIETDEKTGRQKIVVTEIPYQVNKARLVEKIAELVRDKKVEGISDLRDESSREGLRVVVELKKDAFGEIVLNQLYKHSPLESSFGINMLAIVQGRPEVLSIKQVLQHFITHRREVTIRRCRHELAIAENRAHILEGLKRALDVMDEIIRIIRASHSSGEAQASLIETFDFSPRQAKAILELRLQKLTGLERDKILEELAELLKEIERLNNILNHEPLLLQLIKDELVEVRDLFDDQRRSRVLATTSGISAEDLIADEEMVVTITHSGYIKRVPLVEYRAQKRGGRGVQGMNTRDKDFVVELFVASTHTNLLIFTNQGRLYSLKVHQCPKAGRTALGRPIVNLIQFKEGEKMTAVRPLKEFVEGHYAFFATRKGTVKKTALMDYDSSRVRSSGLNAIRLDEDDELIGVDITDGEALIFLGTKNGQAIRFKESDVRSMGRTTRGVRGIRLNEGDEVVSLVVAGEEDDILTVTENGFGKRSPVSEYRLTGRGGKGVITIKCSERNGLVASISKVEEGDQFMFTTNEGRVIRISSDELRTQGRNTQGVRLFRIDKGERLTSTARLKETEEEETEETEGEVTEAQAQEGEAPEGGADAVAAEGQESPDSATEVSENEGAAVANETSAEENSPADPAGE